MKTTDKIIKILERITAYYSSRYDKKEIKVRDMYLKDSDQKPNKKEIGELLELSIDRGVVFGLKKALLLVSRATKNYNSTNIVTADERMLNLLIKPVTDLELTFRAQHCMAYNSIYFVYQLVRYKKRELRGWVKIGPQTIANIEEELAKIGLSLDMKDKIKRYLFKKAERITKTIDEMPDM